MHTMLTLLLCLLPFPVFVLGLYFGRSRAVRVPNPLPHHAADKEYLVVAIDSERHAFTEESLREARSRAIRLGLD